MSAPAAASPTLAARNWVGLGIAGATGAVLCATVAFVDPSRTALGPPCPFKLLTGLDCPLCGATRATHQLLRAHLGRALDFNALYVLALPFAAWMVGAALVARVAGRRPPPPPPPPPPPRRPRGGFAVLPLSGQPALRPRPGPPPRGGGERRRIFPFPPLR